MAPLDELLARLAALGARGAAENAAAQIAGRQAAEADLDRFLLRFAHPAGGTRTPSEPPAGDQAQVA